LLEPEPDCVRRVGRIDGVVGTLVGLDQREKNVQPVTPRSPGFSPPQRFNLAQRAVVIPLVSDRLDDNSKLHSSRRLTRQQERFRKSAFAAEFKRTEVLNPLSFWDLW